MSTIFKTDHVLMTDTIINNPFFNFISMQRLLTITGCRMTLTLHFCITNNVFIIIQFNFYFTRHLKSQLHSSLNIAQRQ